MPKPRALALAALVAAISTSGCSEDRGPTRIDRDAERYRICLDAGGSYSSDGPTDGYSCTLPETTGDAP